jgi:hypothetical protein
MDAYKPIKQLKRTVGNSSDDRDYISILCSKQSPVAVVVGDDSGSLSHSILLPESERLKPVRKITAYIGN